MAATNSLPSAMTRRLEGKVAVITGGASGIGRSAVKLFVEHGAKVVIADIQDDLGQSLVKDLGQSNATYVHCDVTNEDHIKNAVDKAVSTYGKLDIMFNNAGIVDEIKPIMDTEKSNFERVINVNLTGVFLGIKHAARVMVPARSGNIISTASMGSIIAGTGTHAYTSSKHAVLGLTKNAATELGQYGVRVNCLSFYAVTTPMFRKFVGMDVEAMDNMLGSLSTLKGVTLKSEDVANGALFLASDEARYVSGHNLFVDGGFSITNSSLNVLSKNPDA